MSKCICGSYHCEICGIQATETRLGDYHLEVGDKVELIQPLTVLRRTKKGLILCKLGNKEISVPERMLVYKGSVTGQHLPKFNKK